MKFPKALLLLFLSINFLFNQQEANALILRIQNSGADVLFSFDGAIDLTGANISEKPDGSPMLFTVRNMFRSSGTGPLIEIAGTHIGPWGSGNMWTFTSDPVNVPVFGTNSDLIMDSSGYTVTSSGDQFGIQNNRLKLPENYISGSNILGEMRFLDATVAGLDITPGNYSYSLGNNNLEIVAMPAPLPILGLPVVFSYFKKLKEKSRLQRGLQEKRLELI